MLLISLNCSGESLEKACSLFHTSYCSNKDFYDSFDRIVLFYSENLPKKNKSLTGMSGTFSSISNMQHNKLFSVFECEIANSIDKQILKLKENGIITERVAQKMIVDHLRFDKFIANISIDSIFHDYYQLIIACFNRLYPNVELVKLPVRELLEEYIMTNYGYDGHSKLYGLQADGNIGTFYLGNMGKIKQYNMIERICRSASLSPNIYMYIRMIKIYASSIYDEYMIGYRPMTRYIRKSYDLGIKSIPSDLLIIEPANTYFREILDSISSSLSVEERGNLGINIAFNEFLSSKAETCSN